jgi:Mg2+ and Co2+ transporter CorA
MNTGVPGGGSIHAFYVVLAVMAVTLGAVVYYFRKRGFF